MQRIESPSRTTVGVSRIMIQNHHDHGELLTDPKNRLSLQDKFEIQAPCAFLGIGTILLRSYLLKGMPEMRFLNLEISIFGYLCENLIRL
jgi:hypothetical protein